MKIENEAQAVSEARKLLNGEDSDNRDQRGVALAQWVVIDHRRRAREDARRGRKMHVIVICERYSDMTHWAASLNLPAGMYLGTYDRQVHAQCLNERANRWRGMTNACYAIVKMREYTPEEKLIFTAMQMDFGPHEYSPDDRVLIRSWLGVTEPLHG